MLNFMPLIQKYVETKPYRYYCFIRIFIYRL